ncbi:MipA/OmpV family protein [Pseudohongiella spirulinae]|uniref:Structural protein MipA n=1 Tax=Pseudohongiella spirulinae TaxID=1249552 RepID=A0A0S2KBP4_9GAMM|nr:MipA/OmpV family protein [Pseudohongiella spirulinae]ALO45744.1 hypothetical protein PS2015_1081 [Pseudohongiella spirulinae]
MTRIPFRRIESTHPVTALRWYAGCLLSIALALGLPLPAAAQESPQATASAQPSAWTMGVAAGVGRRSNPFVASDDLTQNAIVDLAWYGERWFFDNGDVGYTFNQTDQFSANLLLTFNNERNYFSYLSNGSSGLDISSLRELAIDKGFGTIGIAGGETVDLESLGTSELEEFVFEDLDASLPERDFAVNSGIELLYISRWGDLQAQLLSDVSGTHRGQSAWLAYSYPWITRHSEFSLTLGMEWKSRELVDYYYGVRPDEVIEGRPAYRGKSGVNSVIRFSASRALSERWRLVGVVEQEFLSQNIKRSPIIERGRVSTAFVGIYYQFK